MNIYRWKGHWDYRVYEYKNTYTSCLEIEQKKFDTVQNTINKKIGDFHKLNIGGKVFISMSQKAVDVLNDTLLIYGKLIPIVLDAEQYYFYCLDNELSTIDEFKSILEYNEDDGIFIKKLVLDEKKYNGSLIFTVKNDSEKNIFFTESFLEIVSKYNLRGFLGDFHSTVNIPKTLEDKIIKYRGKSGKFIIHGDDGDYGDWLYYIFNLYDWSKKSLEDTLDTLINATKDMKSFLKYKKTKQSKVIHNVNMYLLRFKYKNTLIEEKDFFKKCVEFPVLHKKVMQYVENVTSLEMDEDTTWQDEMHHRGLYAITPLVFKNEKYIENFGKLLNRWEMSSEVLQSKIIQYIFYKYGITHSTMKLLVWRILTDGQNHLFDYKNILASNTAQNLFDESLFLNVLRDVVNEDVFDNIEYSISDFISVYVNSVEEYNGICHQIKEYLGVKFNLYKCIDKCSLMENNNTSTLDDFTEDFENNWDKYPIEGLVISEYLKDASRKKRCY